MLNKFLNVNCVFKYFVKHHVWLYFEKYYIAFAFKLLNKSIGAQIIYKMFLHLSYSNRFGIFRITIDYFVYKYLNLRA